jgi:hypothetical protein
MNLGHMLKKARSYVENPWNELAKLMPQLLDLQLDLEGAKFLAASEEKLYGNDPFRGLVSFLNSVSPWCDRGGMRELTRLFEVTDYGQGQHRKIIGILNRLDAHLSKVDRDSTSGNGINSTKRGETVTDDDVFLENETCGLLRNPISVWRKLEKTPRNQWKGVFKREYYLANMNAFDVMKDYARKILAEHIDSMIGIINELKEITKVAN